MEAVDVAFAEEARIVCSRALVQLALGRRDAVEEILTTFGQKCVGIVQSAGMAADQADLRADRFDLGALKVDMGSDAPELEAD